MIDVENSAKFMDKGYEDQSKELETAKDTVKKTNTNRAHPYRTLSVPSKPARQL